MDDSEDPILPEDDSVFVGIASDMNESSDALMEDSFSSFIGHHSATSTPSKRARGRSYGGAVRRGTSRSCEISAPVRLQCPSCTNTYANERTFAVHKKMHAMKVASSRTPSLHDFGLEMLSLLESALLIVGAESNVGAVGKELKDYSAQLLENLNDPDLAQPLVSFLSQSFHEMFQRQNALLPSALRSAIYVGTNELISLGENRKSLKDNFMLLAPTSSEVINIFVGIVMLHLSPKVVIYVMRKMRGAVESAVEEERVQHLTDDTNSLNFQQLIYHIGGSVINGFLWKGSKYSGNQTWIITYTDLLRCKFLREPTRANECVDSVRAVSDAKDRGGLKHLNQEAFDFFPVLFQSLMKLEGTDGSLPPAVFHDAVLSEESILILWDNLVGSGVSEEQSLDLLLRMADCCARVVSKGILKRRLNDQLKKAYSSVSLRSRLAR